MPPSGLVTSCLNPSGEQPLWAHHTLCAADSERGQARAATAGAAQAQASLELAAARQAALAAPSGRHSSSGFASASGACAASLAPSEGDVMCAKAERIAHLQQALAHAAAEREGLQIQIQEQAVLHRQLQETRAEISLLHKQAGGPG